MSKLIKCKSIYGNDKLIPIDKLFFRPGVYGIIVNKGKILLVNTKSSGKYFFPGGGIELGEKIENALRREIKEETGINVKIEKFLTFRESFTYYDPFDEATHNFSFFYVCKPLGTELVADNKVEDVESEKPRWIDIKTLKKADFHYFGGEIFQLYLKTVKKLEN